MTWTFRGADTGVGVVGFNVETSLDTEGVPTASETNWPPDVATMANAYSVRNYTKSYSGYTGPDGRRYIGVRPFDALGNRPAGNTTPDRRYFYVRDTTGPHIQVPSGTNDHLALRFRTPTPTAPGSPRPPVATTACPCTAVPWTRIPRTSPSSSSARGSGSATPPTRSANSNGSS